MDGQQFVRRMFHVGQRTDFIEVTVGRVAIGQCDFHFARLQEVFRQGTCTAIVGFDEIIGDTIKIFSIFDVFGNGSCNSFRDT